MPFTLLVLATILLYTWILEPRGLPVELPGTIVALLAGWSGVRSGVWGLSPRALWPATRATLIFTIPAVMAVLAAGQVLGTLHDRGEFFNNISVLIPWGAAQQWVLQTVVLREARQLTSPNMAVLVAAVLFALVHTPNPLLTALTFAGALGWCAIFVRHPNLVPLAVSHAVCTLALLYAFDDTITGRLRIGDAFLRLSF